MLAWHFGQMKLENCLLTPSFAGDDLKLTAFNGEERVRFCGC
jgi:hypothetical protein